MYSVCIFIIKGDSYYDLSVLSMSVMGLDWRVGGWCELYPVLFGIFEIELCKAQWSMIG